jgi:hypothetical protein
MYKSDFVVAHGYNMTTCKGGLSYFSLHSKIGILASAFIVVLESECINNLKGLGMILGLL